MVFVANAGWIMDGLPGGRIKGAVIDAAHPRTFTRLPKLIEKIGKTPLLLIVTPQFVE